MTNNDEVDFYEGWVESEEERQSKIDLDIHNAITFAAKKHDGQKRKGTDIPYIVHPLEVMQILTENECEKEVIIAGILHDTLEDTDTKPEEISRLFGDQILSIVEAESEDKSKSWKERKQSTIDHLAGISFESVLVCCADKLSNLRSMYVDLQDSGDKLWERFNAGKDDIKWYYTSMVKEMSFLADYKMFVELEYLIQEVFNNRNK
ncbi:hypothetical protein AGMMS49944_11490 [Spirochaetia bacterium]|nr:hypothetical protein AGMMS49944_11490 [Spirochaetia bacterium]